MRGHAIEARITAERADLGFQPATGKLSVVDAPHGVRFDSGVEAGSQVSLYYDSMLAKLIAHGADRAAALSRLTSGLSELTLLGVPTIQPFLRDAIAPSAVRRRQGHHALHRDRVSRWLEAERGRAAQPARRGLRGLGRTRRRRSRPHNGSIPGIAAAPSASRRRCGRPRCRCISSTNTARADAEVLVGRDGITVELEGASVDLGRPVIEDGTVKLASPSGHPFIARRDGDVVSIAREGLSLTATIRSADRDAAQPRAGWKNQAT